MITTPVVKPGPKSPAGLNIAKNGKYVYPFKLLLSGEDENIAELGLNSYRQKKPGVGDFCCYAMPSGILSAGTVGKILSVDTDVDIHDGSFEIQFLDGNVEECWQYGVGIMTADQIKEVQDFYIVKEKRPERVKVVLV